MLPHNEKHRYYVTTYPYPKSSLQIQIIKFVSLKNITIAHPKRINIDCYNNNEINLTNHQHDMTPSNLVEWDTNMLQNNTFSETKLLLDTLKHSNIIASPAEVNCHRKVTQMTQKSKQAKDGLQILCNGHTNIFSKWAVEIIKARPTTNDP